MTVTGSYDYYTTKGVPSQGEGPVNTINFARQLSNTTWVQYVTPNENVLYGNAWMNLAKGPLVLTIPPINRYYVMQFMDTFGQVFAYVGARATGSTGGTYLIAGPNFNGIVPNGMHEIKTPTNIAWISNRIFVNGTSDLPNVHAIQNQMHLVPLYALQRNATSTAASLPQPLNESLFNVTPTTKLSPALIRAAGIKVYDAISQAMVGNPQTYPPPSPQLYSNFASIGIGPGKTPSKAAATNSTLNATLQAGITEGEKLINAKIANIGTNVNGWQTVPAGTYAFDYLLRTAVAKFGLGGNAAEEAFYYTGYPDSGGKTLTGDTNYTIHFTPAQVKNAPANPGGFWSITAYNSTNRLVPNPINRYTILLSNPALKNSDGSVDIYVQPQSPGQAKQNNWLPSPTTNQPFYLGLRMYCLNNRLSTEHGHHHQYSVPIQQDSQS